MSWWTSPSPSLHVQSAREGSNNAGYVALVC